MFTFPPVDIKSVISRDVSTGSKNNLKVYRSYRLVTAPDTPTRYIQRWPV